MQYVDVFAMTLPVEALCWGDLTGAPLEAKEVRKARRVDIEYVKQMGVCDNAPLQEAKGGGRNLLGARWVHVEKAGGTHKSRRVAKDIQMYNAPDFVAPTPPIESLKYILRRDMRGRRQQLMRIGVSRAYFYQNAVYAQLPAEGHMTRSTCMAS